MGIISFFFDILGNCFSGVLDVLFEVVKGIFGHKEKGLYNASFHENPHEVLSSDNKGFVLDGKRALSLSDSHKHVLVTGSTGNYKSSGIIIPSYLNLCGHASIVGTDFANDIMPKVSGILYQNGYEVVELSPDNPKRSIGWNPFRQGGESRIGQTIKMLHAPQGSKSSDPFWLLASESLCCVFGKFLFRHCPVEMQSLYNLHRLVTVFSYEPETVDKLFLNANDEDLFMEYKSLLSYGRTLSSVIATARTALAPYGTDQNIALVTSHNTIDFSAFRTRKIALFLRTNTASMKYYSGLMSLFLDQFFAALMQEISTDAHTPLAFLLDESSSIHYSNLQITLANIRKYAAVLQVYQSSSQITDIYSAAQARAIIENCNTKVYMGGQGINTSQELEATLGKTEVIIDDVRHVRSLLTANEIHELSESLIFCSNQRAIKAKVTPYFNQRKLRKMTEVPEYIPPCTLPFDTPPKLNLKP